jgi:hypothetical protein
MIRLKDKLARKTLKKILPSPPRAMDTYPSQQKTLHYLLSSACVAIATATATTPAAAAATTAIFVRSLDARESGTTLTAASKSTAERIGERKAGRAA